MNQPEKRKIIKELSPLRKRGGRGDFPVHRQIKSPSVPLFQRGRLKNNENMNLLTERR
jgi:hypothetical protein